MRSLESLLSPQESAVAPIEKASLLLKSLAHPVRLTVLCSLIEEASSIESTELNVSDLQKITQVSQSVLSQHLSVLKQHNLVATRRESQTIYYRLSDHKIIKIIEVLHELYCDESLNKNVN